MNNPGKDIYDISKYTDTELYNFLDVNNPSDRELEAKIISLIQKYSTIENEASETLSQFFQDIYAHFFDLTVLDDDAEGLENIQVDMQTQEPVKEKEPEKKMVSTGHPDAVAIPSGNIGYTQSLSYTKGTVNPLLKETVKRIISIDSQYRDMATYPLSTDFTFNLSDTLVDVVSIKLYSVQIPYTWYTINNNYGSNFFTINGNSPGINNGNHDYRIAINSGNYIATELVNAVRNSITSIKSNNIDVNFGTTDLSFNLGNVKATMTLDITNTYNDNNYEVYFPTWTDPNNNTNRVNSIPGFLGFNNRNYQTYNIYSNKSNATLNNKYTINDSNSYFTIQIYKGSLNSAGSINEYYDVSNQTILQTIPIIVTPGFYTQSSLIININNQLQSSQYLTDTSFMINSITKITTFSFKINRYTLQYTNNMKACVLFYDESGNPIWTGPASCFNFDTSANQIYNEANNLIAETSILRDEYTVLDNPYIYLRCNQSGYNFTNANDYIITIPLPDNLSRIYNSYDSYANAIQTALTNMEPITPYPDPDINSSIFNQNTYSLDEDTQAKFNFNFARTITTNQFKLRLTSELATILNFPTELDICANTISNNNYQHTIGDNVFTSYFGKNNGGYTVSVNQLRITIDSFGPLNSGVPDIIISPSYIKSSNIYNYIELQNAINSAFTNNSDSRISSGSTAISLIIDPDNSSQIKCTLTMNINAILTENDYTAYFYNDELIAGLTGTTGPTGNSGTSGTTGPTGNSGITGPTGNSGTSGTNGPTGNSGTSGTTGTITYTQAFYGDLSANWSTRPGSWGQIKIPSQNQRLDSNVESDYAVITGNEKITSDASISLIDGSNNFFYIRPVYNVKGGVYTTQANLTRDASYNDIKITIPAPNSSSGNPIKYSIQQLTLLINTALSQDPRTAGSQISSITNSAGNQYTKFRLNINKSFTSQDYKIIFYNPETFTRATTGVIGKSSIQNILWDSTLGWILGFRNLTEYETKPENVTMNINTSQSYYAQSPLTPYEYDTNTNIAKLTGDTCVSVVLYSYFMIILNDYTQNRLNDGLVTIAAKDTDIPLPAYTSKASYTTDLVTGQLVANNSMIGYNNLTANQLYAANQILNAQQTKKSNYSAGPFVQDIFGFIPIKTAGLQNGQTYIEFGGTLQLQERSYFGPVNIHRISVTLLNDKGETIDLNGANWSFALTCEQLYTTNTLNKK